MENLTVRDPQRYAGLHDSIPPAATLRVAPLEEAAVDADGKESSPEPQTTPTNTDVAQPIEGFRSDVLNSKPQS